MARFSIYISVSSKDKESIAYRQIKQTLLGSQRVWLVLFLMEYTKNMGALVFFTLIVLGCFAAHAHGKWELQKYVKITVVFLVSWFTRYTMIFIYRAWSIACNSNSMHDRLLKFSQYPFLSKIFIICLLHINVGRGIDEVSGAPASALQEDKAAQCAYGGHLWCCIHGVDSSACYSSKGDCVRNCKG